MVNSSKWDTLLDVFDSNESFLITTHINPDGDALGSEIALAQYLRAHNKTVHIVNISHTMSNYKFLDPEEDIFVFDTDKHMNLIEETDVFIFVDISDWDRLGLLGKHIRRLKTPTVCIDHHHVTKKFSDIDIIYESASSTGELIYDFLNYTNFEIDIRIATAIYTCILTDTGSFRFSNTNAKTHNIAANLMQKGVDSRKIYEYVYESNSPNKLILMGMALSTLRFECDYRMAWFYITQEMFKKADAHMWDTEGFSEIPRTIKGVEVSLLFTELEKKKIKISLRSKGKIIINQFANRLGGGGHDYAAGAIVSKSLQDTIPWVLSEMIKIINLHQHSLRTNEVHDQLVHSNNGSCK